MNKEKFKIWWLYVTIFAVIFVLVFSPLGNLLAPYLPDKLAENIKIKSAHAATATATAGTVTGTTTDATCAANAWSSDSGSLVTDLGTADNLNEAFITAATFDSPDVSARLYLSNFGFALAAGSTINGIEVDIVRRDAVGGGQDEVVQLTNDLGTQVGDNKALTATGWPATNTSQSYGGATDTWTISPTEAMVEDPDFGVVICAQAADANADVFIDYVNITIHFTAPAAATITLTLDAGGVTAFGTLTSGTRVTGTTRLKAAQTGADSLTITAGRLRAIANVTLASNAAPLVTSNQISDTAGGIDVFNGLANCAVAGSETATWGTGVSTGLGFSNWAASSGKNTTCWGTGTTGTDALNKYAALQASASASSFINIAAAPPATLFTSIGYSLDVSSTQKATTYAGGVVFTATVLP